MASLTTTPSRVLRSPTVYPFAFFFGFGAAAVAVLAARLAGFFAALGALAAGSGASTTGVARHRRGHRRGRSASLADDGVRASEIAPDFTHPRRVLGHPHRQLEAEVEDLLA